MRCLLIQLIAILYNTLLYRRNINGGNLITIMLTTCTWSRIAAHTALSWTKRGGSCFRVISVVLMHLLLATSKHFIVWFFIREQRDLLCLLPEWTLWLWNLLSSHFITWREWILVTLTRWHELLEDLGRTARRLLHHQGVVGFSQEPPWKLCFLPRLSPFWCWYTRRSLS